MRFADVARSFPQSTFWRILAYNQNARGMGGDEPARHHPARIHISCRRRAPLFDSQPAAKGRELCAHAVAHHVAEPAAVALGIFLRSTDGPITYFTFEDTLTQIGLGYTFAFLLTFVKAALAMDCARRNSFRLLAGVGALSRPGRELRLGGRRRPAGLASASLQRLRSALEQEQQSGPGIRRLVSQPFSARSARSPSMGAAI